MQSDRSAKRRRSSTKQTPLEMCMEGEKEKEKQGENDDELIQERQEEDVISSWN